MRSTALFVAALSAGLCVAKPFQNRAYAVKETHLLPHDFKRESDAPSNHLIRLSVGLRQGRFDELEKHLYETSDPDHPRYGQHLSAEEVNELVKPGNETLDLVREWLHEHVEPQHIECSPAEDFMSITLPVAKVEKLLDTKYAVYRHVDGSKLIRTLEWKLPLHLHEHIDAIQPTTSFFRTVPQARTLVEVPDQSSESVNSLSYKHVKNPTVAKVCDTGGVTPLCLRTLYETVNYVPKVPGKNQVGLANYLGEVNNRSDARIYLEKYRPEAVKGADQFKEISIAGGTLSQFPATPGTGVEGALDVETILGISWPTPLLGWSTAGDPPFVPDADNPEVDNEPYLTWVNYVLKQKFIPQVISNSYEDNEQTVPISYAKTVCSQFAQLSARGVSVIFGSGDGGVGGVQPGGSCLSNVNNQTSFIPLFPSSCPYVTSVGGTVGFTPEVVAYDPRNKYSSGGGFSNHFARPSYQDAAVKSYLATIGDEFAGLYNSSGRAYPDIAAYSVNYTIIWNGTLRHVDGTSAATPTIAAIFSLLNDALIAAGKPTLGFLNPWLYKKGYKAFIDVTEGSTLGCNTTGFQATKGWDAASGFGTPRFSKLLKAVGLDDGYGHY
ncbi:tripeptidyl peptidase-like protein [Lophiotrema nucula]|uniref:tripeptidyl-peptidase II n=1 Tax=Lophiotrema nucula TaxID=690887 RepID=A0A6A5ZG57_9PLEO|nr:tripeptidyl peptidase-like protein [Lophiotrema nucula]